MNKKEIIVYKIGGGVLKDKTDLKNTVECLEILPGSTVFVHGGGDLIDSWLDRMKMDVNFINGQRVTDDITMELVEMVLSGSVNKTLTRVLSESGYKAVGLSGRDGGMAAAEFIDSKLGRVGKITNFNPDILKDLLEKEYIPVLSPVSTAPDGGKINVNADFFASRAASVLKAKVLNIITSTGGVLKEGNIINNIECKEVTGLIGSAVVSEGMIPKLQAAVRAIEGGAKSVELLNYSGNKGTCIR
ncbi:MAG: acetylglutamate kinase [Elusimicrobiota bacterium]